MTDYTQLMVITRDDILRIANFIHDVHAAIEDLVESSDTFHFNTPEIYVQYRKDHNDESPLDNLRVFGEVMRSMANENQSNVGRSNSGDQSEIIDKAIG